MNSRPPETGRAVVVDAVGVVVAAAQELLAGVVARAGQADVGIGGDPQLPVDPGAQVDPVVLVDAAQGRAGHLVAPEGLLLGD